jgi:hypothetical protein
MPSLARAGQAQSKYDDDSGFRRLLPLAHGANCVASDNLNVFGCPRGHNREAGERPARYRHCKCEAFAQSHWVSVERLGKEGRGAAAKAAERASQETCPKPTARKSHALLFAAPRCGSHQRCRF